MIYDLSYNAKIIVAKTYDYNKLLELKSVKQFINYLNKKIKKLNYNFYFFWGIKIEENYLLQELSSICRGNDILFWIGDEEGYIPSNYLFKRFEFIFKVHLRDNDALCVENDINIYREGLFHFPLLTIDDVPELPVLPFEERKYELYYCGNLNKNRLPFYLSLNKKAMLYEYSIAFLLKHNLRGGDYLFNMCYSGKSFDLSDAYKKSYIKFYSGFNNGDDYYTYASLLQNSKIVLSPKGFHSTECFRFYEAMRQGCIVITEKLPKVECYKDSPCVVIDSWKKLPQIILDTNLFDTFNPYSIKKYYDDKLSIEGIANYVYKTIIKNHKRI